MQAFASDRAKFRASLPRMGLPQAIGQLRIMLDRIEQLLADGRAYLFGDAVSIADFSVYHNIWFIHDVAGLPEIIVEHKRIGEWRSKMATFGHGAFDVIDSSLALQIARESKPAGFAGRQSDELYASHLGQRVTVEPSDYGLDPVEGELVFADASEFALKRFDDRAGEVVVHFPRMGFQLKKMD